MAVLTLAAAKAHLNITVSTHDDEIQGMIDSAVAAIAERVGPIEAVAKTVRVTPLARHLRVPGPAISLTSITDADGVAETLGDLYLEQGPGLISFNDGRSFASRYYTVVYSAGRATIPKDLVLAVAELVRHFWATQRGPTQRPGAKGSETMANSVPGAAYLLPFRVSELIKPHMPILVG